MAEMGENLMKGLAKVLRGASSQVTSAMTAVSQDVIGALTVPSGSFSLSGDASAALGVSAGRSITQNNVYNVFNHAAAAQCGRPGRRTDRGYSPG